jgi:hypothetical protein
MVLTYTGKESDALAKRLGTLGNHYVIHFFEFSSKVRLAIFGRWDIPMLDAIAQLFALRLRTLRIRPHW